MKIFVNSLTILRMIATFFVPLIWKTNNPIFIIVSVSLIILTDFFDGMLARMFHVQTLFGSIMDTVADKLFGIIIVLVIALENPVYYVIVFFESSIALINVGAALRGATTKSSFIGRCKMWVLGLAIVAGIADIFYTDLSFLENIGIIANLLEQHDNFIVSCVFLCAGAELMVIIDYCRNFTKELRKKTTKVSYKVKPKVELKKTLFDTEYYLENKNNPVHQSLFKS